VAMTLVEPGSVCAVQHRASREDVEEDREVDQALEEEEARKSNPNAACGLSCRCASPAYSFRIEHVARRFLSNLGGEREEVMGSRRTGMEMGAASRVRIPAKSHVPKATTKTKTTPALSAARFTPQQEANASAHSAVNRFHAALQSEVFFRTPVSGIRSTFLVPGHNRTARAGTPGPTEKQNQTQNSDFLLQARFTPQQEANASAHSAVNRFHVPLQSEVFFRTPVSGIRSTFLVPGHNRTARAGTPGPTEKQNQTQKPRFFAAGQVHPTARSKRL